MLPFTALPTFILFFLLHVAAAANPAVVLCCVVVVFAKRGEQGVVQYLPGGEGSMQCDTTCTGDSWIVPAT